MVDFYFLNGLQAFFTDCIIHFSYEVHVEGKVFMRECKGLKVATKEGGRQDV